MSEEGAGSSETREDVGWPMCSSPSERGLDRVLCARARGGGELEVGGAGDGARSRPGRGEIRPAGRPAGPAGAKGPRRIGQAGRRSAAPAPRRSV